MLLVTIGLVVLASPLQSQIAAFPERPAQPPRHQIAQISDLRAAAGIAHEEMNAGSSLSPSGSTKQEETVTQGTNPTSSSPFAIGGLLPYSYSHSLYSDQFLSSSPLPVKDKEAFNMASFAQKQYLVIMKPDKNQVLSDSTSTGSSHILPLPIALGQKDDQVEIKENSRSYSNHSLLNDISSFSSPALTVREQVMQITEQVKDRLGNRAQFEVTRVFENALDGFTIRVADGAAQGEILSALMQDPRVAFVEQDQIVYAFRHQLRKFPWMPQQPSQPSQLLPNGVNRIDSDLSSTVAGNNKGIVNADIAVLDSGIDLKHQDLNVYRQKTFVTGTSSANDNNGHGTHVAGIAAAKDNQVGVVGAAPGAKLWAIKVLDKNGAGLLSDVIAGIDYITANAKEIDVVNISFGCECKSSALDSSINNSISKGITYVVAAGNSGKNAQSFSPASNPNVITVSAIVDTDGKCGGKGPATSYGKDDSFATFSNYGGAVDISAPGVGIYSTDKGASYSTMTGTSMATPHASGAAALYKALNPTGLYI